MKFAALSLSCALLLGVNAVQSAQQTKPDIEVRSPISLESPQAKNSSITAEQGDRVLITATISNKEAEASVDRPFDVIFQIQLNKEGERTSTLGSNQVTCLTFQNREDSSKCTVPGLSAQGGPNAQLDIKAQLNTSGIDPNAYIIHVVADPDNRIPEVDEQNNDAIGQLTLTPRLPNLTVLSETALVPSQPRQGDLVTLEFTIENDRAGADVQGTFSISIAFRKLGDTTFTSLVPPALSCPDCIVENLPGFDASQPKDNRKTIRAQFTTILMDPGAYELRVTVDSTNLVVEADESDNVLTLDFTLASPVRNLTLASGRLIPSTPGQGSLVTLSFSIQNESLGIVTGVELQFSLRQLETNAVFDLRSLPSFACGAVGSFEPARDKCAALAIGPNGALEVLVQFATSTLTLGNYELQLIVDPEGSILETNEQDNTLILPFALVEPGKETPQIGPELHPIALTLAPTSPVVQGQKVLASATITNSGNQDAKEFRVEFSFRREDGSAGQQGFVSFAAQIISGLRLGKNTEVKTIFDTTGLEPGLYAIRAVVNALGQAELDGNNNAIIAFLTVLPKP